MTKRKPSRALRDADTALRLELKAFQVNTDNVWDARLERLVTAARMAALCQAVDICEERQAYWQTEKRYWESVGARRADQLRVQAQHHYTEAIQICERLERLLSDDEIE